MGTVVVAVLAAKTRVGLAFLRAVGAMTDYDVLEDRPGVPQMYRKRGEPPTSGASKLANGASEPDDAQQGQWLRERLLQMDACFCKRVERAIAAGDESERAAQATVDSCQPCAISRYCCRPTAVDAQERHVGGQARQTIGTPRHDFSGAPGAPDEYNSPRKTPSPIAFARFEPLAASRDGCTDAIMLAHGFTIPLMVELVRAGLATATTERVVDGSRTFEVAGKDH